MEIPGTYAEQAVVDSSRLVPLPDGVDFEAAAAVLLQGMTAHYLVKDAYPVQPSDTVLVHAAAGGMGLVLTQLITHLGGRVIGTTSTPEKAPSAVFSLPSDQADPVSACPPLRGRPRERRGRGRASASACCLTRWYRSRYRSRS
ncbi:hypothetical protein AB0D46_25820 [Streptomyces sp. NPDC048383]|uniref:hypothetical protein n=1 Tax=Streptomyces sp. NPDC048383 TaxID=3155386 RepID=UPI00342949D0